MDTRQSYKTNPDVTSYADNEKVILTRYPEEKGQTKELVDIQTSGANLSQNSKNEDSSEDEEINEENAACYMSLSSASYSKEKDHPSGECKYLNKDMQSYMTLAEAKYRNNDIQRALTLASSISTQIPFPLEEMGDLLQLTKAEGISQSLILKLFKDSFPNIPSKSESEDDSSYSFMPEYQVPSISTMESLDIEEDLERYLAKFTPPVGAAMEELQILNSYLKIEANNTDLSNDDSASTWRVISLDRTEFYDLLRSLVSIKDPALSNTYHEPDIMKIEMCLLNSFEKILGYSIDVTEFPIKSSLSSVEWSSSSATENQVIQLKDRVLNLFEMLCFDPYFECFDNSTVTDSMNSLQVSIKSLDKLFLREYEDSEIVEKLREELKK